MPAIGVVVISEAVAEFDDCPNDGGLCEYSGNTEGFYDNQQDKLSVNNKNIVTCHDGHDWECEIT